MFTQRSLGTFRVVAAFSFAFFVLSALLLPLVVAGTLQQAQFWSALLSPRLTLLLLVSTGTVFWASLLAMKWIAGSLERAGGV